MAELIGKAVGQAVNGIVDVVDVDGVVRRVDVDDAIQRIDMNDLLDKVDMNRLIDRVDLNRQLDRVDLDRALRRVDVNALVLRSNVGAILTHSTTGIFSDILDTIRASVVHADIWIYIGMSFLLRRDVNVLPPVPGETNERKKPATEMALSTSVQGCLNGVVSKGLSVLVDSFLVTFSFALLLIVVEMGWKVLTDGDNRPQIDRDSRYALVSYCMYWFVYFWFWSVAAHRTIGMAILGLKVVDVRTGQNITATQGFIRTALLPLSGVVAMILVVVGLWRHDGRMLHDVVAGTGLVYKWNAAMAKFRAHAEQEQQLLVAQEQEQQAGVAASGTMNRPLLHTTASEATYSSFHEEHQK
mmetsp:Transcript_15461/g.29521  ORF Transcript_15461/g.29521 Transcript_15461/m.29521 type:complete len:356 (+) Transcript_15461:148-1215(+)